MTHYAQTAYGPKIGILAGMGPSSTAPFLDLVYQACRDQAGSFYDGDFPRIMVCSQPVPFFHDRPIDDAAICNGTIEGLRDLEAAGCNVIGIACNSVHVYFEELQASVGKPLLNIVEEALNALPSTARRIAIAASRPLAESNLYHNAARLRGLEVVEPAWQADIDHLQSLVKGTVEDGLLRDAWRNLVSRLAPTHEVDAIVIACLDLTATLRHAAPLVPIVDAGNELAASLVRHWHNAL